MAASTAANRAVVTSAGLASDQARGMHRAISPGLKL